MLSRILHCVLTLHTLLLSSPNVHIVDDVMTSEKVRAHSELSMTLTSIHNSSELMSCDAKKCSESTLYIQ